MVVYAYSKARKGRYSKENVQGRALIGGYLVNYFTVINQTKKIMSLVNIVSPNQEILANVFIYKINFSCIFKLSYIT